jgi:hypothetical protein
MAIKPWKDKKEALAALRKLHKHHTKLHAKHGKAHEKLQKKLQLDVQDAHKRLTMMRFPH